MALMPGLGLTDLFRIGIGPSSSHTVGPMLAAATFAEEVAATGALEHVHRVEVDLFGSLAATGAGHGTLGAVLLGLDGHRPDAVDPGFAKRRVAEIEVAGSLMLAGRHRLRFNGSDIRSRPLTVLPRHTNALRITALDESGEVLALETFYSIGGGFVEREDTNGSPAADRVVPYPFGSGADLLDVCSALGVSVAGLAMANESADSPSAEVEAELDRIAAAMNDCIERGLRTEGVLPGGLGVRRRASGWRSQLESEAEPYAHRHAAEWTSLWALAVNEENADGGRVVTAPTNGAAGVIPAVLRYAAVFRSESLPPHSHRIFLLTAAVIGALIKTRASISGAEVGCQGEIGSACAMAAAGLTAVLGGSVAQVESAAEIGMEHHLGLTCDPVGGLVQIPCIERNAMAAATAVNAAAIALRGDGRHIVSLDDVIETMRATGADMSDAYKETARAGLAAQLAPRFSGAHVMC